MTTGRINQITIVQRKTSSPVLTPEQKSINNQETEVSRCCFWAVQNYHLKWMNPCNRKSVLNSLVQKCSHR